MIRPLFLVLLLAVSTPVLAQSSPPRAGANGGAHYGWADVLRVDPVYDAVRVERPQQTCYEQPVRRGGGDTTAGTVLGAVIGGVLGNTVGKGDGRKAATVAGAVVGGAIGHGAAERSQGGYADSETRCDQVTAVSHQRRLIGYDVEYSYHGDIYVSRLDYDPGERLRVQVRVSPAD